MNGKVYYGWWVVVGASCTLFFCGGIAFPSFSVFLKFIEADMHWGRDSLSNAGALAALAAGLTAPIIGYALDRFSARAVMLPGAIILSACFILVAGIESVRHLYIVFLAIGYGMAATLILR
ncbi:MAG: hypothetical protein JSV16_02180, partial [Candidatus Hydrogenedentota bacterium]